MSKKKLWELIDDVNWSYDTTFKDALCSAYWHRQNDFAIENLPYSEENKNDLIKAYEFITNGHVAVRPSEDVQLIPEGFRYCSQHTVYDVGSTGDPAAFSIYHKEPMMEVDLNDLAKDLTRSLGYDAVYESDGWMFDFIDLTVHDIDTWSMTEEEYDEFVLKVDSVDLSDSGVSIYACHDVSGYKYWNDPDNGMNYVSFRIQVFHSDITTEDIECLLLDTLTDFEKYKASGEKMLEYMDKGYYP